MFMAFIAFTFMLIGFIHGAAGFAFDAAPPLMFLNIAAAVAGGAPGPG